MFEWVLQQPWCSCGFTVGLLVSNKQPWLAVSLEGVLRVQIEDVVVVSIASTSASSCTSASASTGSAAALAAAAAAAAAATTNGGARTRSVETLAAWKANSHSSPRGLQRALQVASTFGGGGGGGGDVFFSCSVGSDVDNSARCRRNGVASSPGGRRWRLV